jgi:hypothetical protein
VQRHRQEHRAAKRDSQQNGPDPRQKPTDPYGLLSQQRQCCQALDRHRQRHDMSSAALMFFGDSDYLPHFHLGKQGVMDVLNKPDHASHDTGGNQVGDQNGVNHARRLP